MTLRFHSCSTNTHKTLLIYSCYFLGPPTRTFCSHNGLIHQCKVKEKGQKAGLVHSRATFRSPLTATKYIILFVYMLYGLCLLILQSDVTSPKQERSYATALDAQLVMCDGAIIQFYKQYTDMLQADYYSIAHSHAVVPRLFPPPPERPGNKATIARLFSPLLTTLEA